MAAILNKWYTRLRPLRVDLVGDYAGSELFVVDGDSLLRHLWSDSRIDFDNGFQLLHAVYVVERWVEQVQRRKCRVHVAFFAVHANLCVHSGVSEANREKFFLARKIIIEHLKQVEGGLLWEFENMDDSKFKDYLNNERPMFAMVHDGAEKRKKYVPNLKAPENDGRATKAMGGAGDWDAESSSEDEDIAIDQADGTEEDEKVTPAVLLKAVIWRFMQAGYNVALASEVVFVDSKIFTSVLEASPGPDIELPENTVPKTLTESYGPYSFPSLKSQRERLAVAAISAVKPDDVRWASTFLLHTVLLKYLSLQERAFPGDVGAKQPNNDRLLEKVISVSRSLLEKGSVEIGDAEAKDLSDYIDGRLLQRLFQPFGEIPESAENDHAALVAEVQKLSGLELPPLSESPTKSEAPLETHNVEAVKPQPILPFSNPIFDEHLQSVKLNVDIAPDTEEDSSVPHPGHFKELYHWHNADKPLVQTTTKVKKPFLNKGRGVPQEQVVDKRKMGRARKWEQLYLSQMNQYAASLTDAQGGMLEPKLVIVETPAERAAKEKKAGKQIHAKKEAEKPAKKEVEKPSKKEAEKPGKKEVVKPGKKGAGKAAPAGKATKADMLTQNAIKVAAKEAEKLQQTWKAVRREIDQMRDPEASLLRLDAFLRQTRKKIPSDAAGDHEARFVEVEAMFNKVLILRNRWIVQCEKGAKQEAMPIAALLFDNARRTLSKQGLTKKIYSLIETLFKELGISMPPPPTDPLPDRKLLCDVIWSDVKGKNVALGLSSEEFQMLHCGELMDRDMDSAKDDRVTGFYPDKWQRQVLDELDSENSVLVVAPTSAGKTFISFYAMDKVLRQSDEGVLVYVAPTKALVNQIAAEVIARFSKNYKYAGKTVWAIHTRDYRMNNPNECQVLVTVPHILQIMLLSPTNAKNWAPRIKRIIFDEVHSIGNADDGVVWEQLLLLAPCPMIALSATVGNPEDFSTWLANTQQTTQGKKMTMIRWPHRYSDLRKYVYGPGALPVGSEFHGVGRKDPFGILENEEGLYAMHPIASLREATTAIPDDLALEPRDLWVLFWAMHKHQIEKYPVSDSLHPKTIFGNRGKVIKKAEVLRWEVDLKRTLGEWMQNGASPFPKVLEELRGKRFEELKSSTHPSLMVMKKPDDTEDVEEESETGTSLYVQQSTLPLLRSLHHDDALPAILFSFNRNMCESLCKTLTDQLRDAEAEYRKNDPKWAAKVKTWEAYIKDKSRSKPNMSKVKGKLQEGDAGKDERMRDEGDISWMDTFNPEAPSPEFSFADARKYSKSELENDIFNLRERWGIDEYLIRAFERGIGVHHAGMNRKYRQAIEMLFRSGFLRVVIATGTLALGINAPCKTVVFSGDSVYLTALNYRQAAGRAGRRGFDNIGNVIFHGFPVDRVQRLIASKLPSLQGHFPISTSLILRLFILLDNSKESDHAKSAINSLLTQPRLVMGGNEFKEQVLHHLRFSIEFLRRQKLLSSNGTPLNFAGLASHLYYTESSAFAFHALLLSGYLEKICKDVDKKPETTAMSLMLIFAHIFSRMPARRGMKALPPMPAEAIAVLRQQNAETLSTYTTYVKTYSQEYCNEIPDNVLPLSHQACGGSGVSKAQTNPPLARSSFVALSGHGDTFSSVADLTSSVRNGIFLEPASVPYLPVDQDAPSAWLYEFYRTGDVRKMVEEYGIRRGEIWFVLKDVSLIIATIVTGLACFMRDGPGHYFDMDETAGGEEGEGEWVEAEPLEGEEDVERVGGGLGKVLKGFVVAKKTFDERYKKMWA